MDTLSNAPSPKTPAEMDIDYKELIKKFCTEIKYETINEDEKKDITITDNILMKQESSDNDYNSNVIKIHSNFQIDLDLQVEDDTSNDNTIIHKVITPPETSISISKRKRLYVCKICSSDFFDLEHFKNHLYHMHRPIIMEFYSDAFYNNCKNSFKEDLYKIPCLNKNLTTLESNNEKSYTTMGLLYKCNICNEKFRLEDNLKTHLFITHRPLEFKTFEGVFCDRCKDWVLEKCYYNHAPCYSVEDTCLFCSLHLPTKKHFEKHNLIWENWRCYQCSLCKTNTKNFSTDGLHIHMKITHLKKSIFGCFKCNYVFVNMSQVEAHFDSFHSGCKCDNYNCICNKLNLKDYSNYFASKYMEDNNQTTSTFPIIDLLNHKLGNQIEEQLRNFKLNNFIEPIKNISKKVIDSSSKDITYSDDNGNLELVTTSKNSVIEGANIIQQYIGSVLIGVY